jgi:thioredoxin 1
VQDLTDATFEHEVLQAEGPVIVDFWAPWCGPCHAVEPVLRQLEEEFGARVKFAKLDIDANMQTASQYDVLSIPTAILFEDGRPRETVVGARPRSYYEQAWARWLTPAQA